MKMKADDPRPQFVNSTQILIGLTLALLVFARCACAQTQPTDARPAETKGAPETYETLYLTNLTQEHDANDIQTALRNMLPRARLYYVPSQSAISIRATAEDMLLAKKILSDLDRVKKTYRLTYTITETEAGKSIGTRHLSLIVVSGGKTELKEGNRQPLVTGGVDGGTTTSQVQYVDLGLNIDASVSGYLDGLSLWTKVEQSSLSEEKSGVGAQDPVIHQTMLEGTSTLVPGKPTILGSIDLPGSARHQEIEVVSELVR